MRWKIWFVLGWLLHQAGYAHEGDGSAQYCYFCGRNLARSWPLKRFVT
jgi:hypothetical protein